MTSHWPTFKVRQSPRSPEPENTSAFTKTFETQSFAPQKVLTPVLAQALPFQRAFNGGEYISGRQIYSP
jgi:hypothetical protein